MLKLEQRYVSFLSSIICKTTSTSKQIEQAQRFHSRAARRLHPLAYNEFAERRQQDQEPGTNQRERVAVKHCQHLLPMLYSQHKYNGRILLRGALSKAPETSMLQASTSFFWRVNQNMTDMGIGQKVYDDPAKIHQREWTSRHAGMQHARIRVS